MHVRATFVSLIFRNFAWNDGIKSFFCILGASWVGWGQVEWYWHVGIFCFVWYSVTELRCYLLLRGHYFHNHPRIDHPLLLSVKWWRWEIRKMQRQKKSLSWHNRQALLLHICISVTFSSFPRMFYGIYFDVGCRIPEIILHPLLWYFGRLPVAYSTIFLENCQMGKKYWY